VGRVVRDLAAAGGMADMDGAPEVEMVGKHRDIGGGRAGHAR
jgi:hypothetical protein